MSYSNARICNQRYLSGTPWHPKPNKQDWLRKQDFCSAPQQRLHRIQRQKHVREIEKMQEMATTVLIKELVKTVVKDLATVRITHIRPAQIKRKMLMVIVLLCCLRLVETQAFPQAFQRARIDKQVRLVNDSTSTAVALLQPRLANPPLEPITFFYAGERYSERADCLERSTRFKEKLATQIHIIPPTSLINSLICGSENDEPLEGENSIEQFVNNTQK